MAEAKKSIGNGSKPKVATVKKQIISKDLPASYYNGQDKKTKPKKDKNGDIIPG